MKYYMHTIDGKPAAFEKDQICYWWDKAKLVKSLRTIKRQRQKSIEFRRKNFPKVPLVDYGYIIVRVPDEG